MKQRNEELEKTHIPKSKMIEEVAARVMQLMTKNATEDEKKLIYEKKLLFRK